MGICRKSKHHLTRGTNGAVYISDNLFLAQLCVTFKSKVFKADSSLCKTFPDTEILSLKDNRKPKQKKQTKQKKSLFLHMNSLLVALKPLKQTTSCALTLASPSSNQHVALLALAVVRAHAVDTAPPLAVQRSFTFIDI